MRKRGTEPPRPKDYRVQQHHAIGNSPTDIMRKHIRTPNRMLPPGDPNATRKPRFEALPSLSYHEMLNKVADVKSEFNRLPARTRTRFGNDPYQYLRFVEDPKNRQECLRMGLLSMTDEEYMAASDKAEAERLDRIEALRKAKEPERASHLPDDEAQPDFSSKARQGQKSPPQKGGKGE